MSLASLLEQENSLFSSTHARASRREILEQLERLWKSHLPRGFQCEFVRRELFLSAGVSQDISNPSPFESLFSLDENIDHIDELIPQHVELFLFLRRGSIQSARDMLGDSPRDPISLQGESFFSANGYRAFWHYSSALCELTCRNLDSASIQLTNTIRFLRRWAEQRSRSQGVQWIRMRRVAEKSLLFGFRLSLRTQLFEKISGLDDISSVLNLLSGKLLSDSFRHQFLVELIVHSLFRAAHCHKSLERKPWSTLFSLSPQIMHSPLEESLLALEYIGREIQSPFVSCSKKMTMIYGRLATIGFFDAGLSSLLLRFRLERVYLTLTADALHDVLQFALVLSLNHQFKKALTVLREFSKLIETFSESTNERIRLQTVAQLRISYILRSVFGKGEDAIIQLKSIEKPAHYLSSSYEYSMLSSLWIAADHSRFPIRERILRLKDIACTMETSWNSSRSVLRPECLYKLAFSLARLRDLAKAVSICDILVRSFPNIADGWILLLLLLTAQKRYRKALSLCDQVYHTLFPHDIRFALIMIHVEGILGIDSERHSLKLPTWFDSVVQLIITRFDLAEKHLIKLDDRLQRSIDWNHLWSQQYYDVEVPPSAQNLSTVVNPIIREQIRRCLALLCFRELDILVSSSSYLNMTSNKELDLKEVVLRTPFAEAEMEFTVSREIGDFLSHSSSTFSSGSASLNPRTPPFLSRSLEHVERLLSRLELLGHSSVEFSLLAGLHLCVRGQTHDGLAFMERSFFSASDDMPYSAWKRIAAYEIATAYANSGRSILARRKIIEGIRLCPEDHRAWYLLGKLQRDTGDEEGAVQSFRTCLQLEQTSPLIDYHMLLPLELPEY